MESQNSRKMARLCAWRLIKTIINLLGPQLYQVLELVVRHYKFHSIPSFVQESRRVLLRSNIYILCTCRQLSLISFIFFQDRQTQCLHDKSKLLAGRGERGPFQCFSNPRSNRADTDDQYHFEISNMPVFCNRPIS